MRIVGDDVAERAEFVVCATYKECMDPRTRMLAESLAGQQKLLRGVCSKCGVEIGFSDKSPKKPPKICMDCFFALAPTIEAETATGPHNRELFSALFGSPEEFDRLLQEDIDEHQKKKGDA